MFVIYFGDLCTYIFPNLSNNVQTQRSQNIKGPGSANETETFKGYRIYPVSYIREILIGRVAVVLFFQVTHLVFTETAKALVKCTSYFD